MCQPRDRITRLSLFLDVSGQPLGATVTTHFQSDHEKHQPIDCGPFDTLGEVLVRCMAAVEVQQALDLLWS